MFGITMKALAFESEAEVWQQNPEQQAFRFPESASGSFARRG
jgi:hypothetical protein